MCVEIEGPNKSCVRQGYKGTPNKPKPTCCRPLGRKNTHTHPYYSGLCKTHINFNREPPYKLAGMKPPPKLRPRESPTKIHTHTKPIRNGKPKSFFWGTPLTHTHTHTNRFAIRVSDLTHFRAARGTPNPPHSDHTTLISYLDLMPQFSCNPNMPPILVWGQC